jgi:hydrogenase maturation protein HypF
MVANAASVAAWTRTEPDAATALGSPERPVVLLPKRAGCDAALPGIAPGVGALGVMLPYTPVHYLLFHEAAGRPRGLGWLDTPWDVALVMTSANPGGEPLVIDNDEALRRLDGIADAFLVHDRDILTRCDDSVVQAVGGTQVFVRRSRGYTPRAIALAHSSPPVLATGAWLKSTACVIHGDRAFLTEHVGDLANRATSQALQRSASHLLRVLRVEPAVVAHDLHPDLPSTRFALRFAATHGIPALAVQHHHAHVAAVAAEHRLEGRVLGLAVDGVGLGTDGTAWGGELLEAGRGFRRLGHLHPLALPGGDRAATEPWRMAASALHALGRAAEIDARFCERGAGAIGEMLDRGLNCPPTSSAGRLFDAAAALLGVREEQSYEAQGAMELEALALVHGPIAPMAGGWRITGDNALDLLPLLDALADCADATRGAALFHCADAARGAALFHETLAAALAQWVARAARERDHERVLLCGGCMLNTVLAARLRERLTALGLDVREAREAPPGDGGLSLGQAWVAAQQLSSGG